MKYIKYLLITLLLVPFIVLAETKNVEIKSISNYVDKSDNVEELEKPSIEGLKLGFKLKFTKQDDFIKYKFIIKNNTDKDYEIDNSSTFNEKKFIRYDYEVENNAKVLKANEELTVNITITYVKELDDSEFDNGVFTETNQVSLELVNDSNEIIDNPVIKMVTNPETSTGYILLAIIAIILSLVLILFISNKKAKLFLLTILLLIPITIYALERIKIDVETYVEIEKKYNFTIINKCSNDADDTEERNELSFEFMRGMNFNDYINSKYFEELSDLKKEMFENLFVENYDSNYMDFYNQKLYDCINEIEYPEHRSGMTNEETAEYYNELSIANNKRSICIQTHGNTENVNIQSEIKDSSKGVYFSNLYCPS